MVENSVKTLFQPEECDAEEAAEEVRHNQQNMAGLTVMEKMQLWNHLRSEHIVGENLDLLDMDEEYEHYAITHFPESWRFLTESHAYKWLIEKIKCSILLTEFGGTVMEHIGNEITKGLKPVSRGHSYNTGVNHASFEISWDLPVFITKEFPDETSLQLGSIITLTGSSFDAQTLTCAEYRRQVWPTTGPETLKVLQEVMDKGEETGRSHSCKQYFHDAWRSP
jgi:hypothetical protein